MRHPKYKIDAAADYGQRLGMIPPAAPPAENHVNKKRGAKAQSIEDPSAIAVDEPSNSPAAAGHGHGAVQGGAGQHHGHGKGGHS